MENEMNDLSNVGQNPKSLPPRSQSAGTIDINSISSNSVSDIPLPNENINVPLVSHNNNNNNQNNKESKINTFSFTSNVSPNQSSVTWHAGADPSSFKHAVSTINSNNNNNNNGYNSRKSHAKNVFPIEFRTLSIQVGDTIQANNAKKLLEEIKKAKELGLVKPEDTITTTTTTIPNITAIPESKPTPTSLVDDTNYFASLNIHRLNDNELSIKFGTDTALGLPATEASRRLSVNGPNKLSTKSPNYVLKILKYLFGGFCSVLWVGVIVFFLCYSPLSNPPSMINFALAILVIVVILTQAGFSAFQDWSTGKVMNSILNMLPSDCLVIRNGQTLKINSNTLVTGDLVQLHLGNKVPADLVMVSSADLKVDKAVLTGESKPIQCTTQLTDENFLESRNVVLMGTHVVNGSGTGLVVLTGNNTVMGRINKLTNDAKEKVPIIQKEINRFVLIIVCATIGLAAILALEWGVFLHRVHPDFQTPIVMLQSVMSCVVAFIPEGVPLIVSLTLMMIAKKMKESKILPKTLTTVETLGCVNVICSDKTGTLTQNKMTVTSIGFVDRQTTPENSQYEMINSNISQNTTKAYNQIHYTSALCNNSTWDANTLHNPLPNRLIIGDATDAAIFRLGHNFLSVVPEIDLESCYPRLHDLPFNSKNKFMMTIHSVAPKSGGDFGVVENDEHLMLVKGAPDVLLPRCNSILVSSTNTVESLSPEHLNKIKMIQENWSRDGKRVLLLTKRILRLVNQPSTGQMFREESEASVDKLTIIGLLGIMDPPRPEIIETVAQCRKSGIRFFMVTGDFGLTATSIARQIGIYTNKEAEPDTYSHIIAQLEKHSELEIKVHNSDQLSSLLITGPDLNQMMDNKEQWDIVAQYDEIVFARTTPEQKLRIVKEFQNRDNVVAVTGDGVNDAPALKQADVGVAVLGCDVAVEAADLVLLETFGSITQAIRLGRLVFQNLQKGIGYLLPAGSYSEITPVLVNAFFGTPCPLSSFLMIIICCFTDVFPCLSLILEKEEFDLMSQKPRNAKKDHLITYRIYIQSYLFMGTLLTVISQGLFFGYLKEYTGLGWNELVFTYGDIDFSKAKVTPEEFANYHVPVGTCVTFIALVILQWGNILSIRNRRESILKADPFRAKRRNLHIFYGMLASLIIAIIVTEVPWFNKVFLTGSVPIKYWLLPVPFAIIILIVDELRKFAIRHNVPVITYLAW